MLIISTSSTFSCWFSFSESLVCRTLLVGGRAAVDCGSTVCFAAGGTSRIVKESLRVCYRHHSHIRECIMLVEWFGLLFSLVEEQYQLVSYQLHVLRQAVHLGQPKNCSGCAEVSQSHQEMYNTHRMDQAVAEQQRGFHKDLFGVEVPVED